MKDQDDIEVIKTRDGSSSLYLKKLNETYHSVHGATIEAFYVFIERGLYEVMSNNHQIALLEIGFGTGLNALLSCMKSRDKDVHIQYTSLETRPLDWKILSELSYSKLDQKLFKRIHESPWNASHEIEEHFHLNKIHVAVQDFHAQEGRYNLIYFDAFGPQAQEEMWTPEIFQKMYDVLSPGGILVTYCAKGQVRRDLESCGFNVERLPGPPGKREMLRATK